MMEFNSRIYVAGHKGLVGSSLSDTLMQKGYVNVTGVSHKMLDLTDKVKVFDYFRQFRPEYVFLAAAKVGGIHANNTYPADFINNNLQIQANIINACHEFQVRKLLFLGSVCIYPKYASEPVKETSLLTGELEPTNQWYAVAKIAGIKMCQAFRKQYLSNFISVMPCNLYGIGDNFHPENSHVLPALLRKFHLAKQNNMDEVVCWGTGNARREFMFAEDLGDALVFLMNTYHDGEIINVGTGSDVSIKEVAELVAKAVGYKGRIVWDTSKPDGTPSRLLDCSKLNTLGWKSKTTLEDGIKKTYEWYKKGCDKDGNLKLSAGIL